MSQTINFELFNSELVTQRFGYRLRTYPRYRTDIMLLDRLRRRNLEIPEAGNDRARQFATDLRASVNTDREFARAVLAHFQQEEFYYTLNPPLLGDNSVDEFLFSTRQGFCEHYASSFTYLMRSVGIPARVVVGYQGAEYNRFEDYLMVYQYNAHAWSEVWLEGEGWIRFDPTGAVSPERITLGVEAVLQNQPGFLSESFFSRYRSMSWLNTLRLRMDALEYEWNRRVVSYNDERQMQLLQSILGDATERRILILLVALVGVVVLVLAFSIIRFNGRRLDPVTRLYFAFCDDLRRAGMPRNKGEGPLDFCRRIELSRPDLAERAHAFTRLYMQLQYESIPQDPKGRQNREAHRQLRKLLMRSRLGMVPFLR
ncbi:MAG: transglutaminase domain-containing protein [Pseudohongiellaceae bacterium]